MLGMEVWEGVISITEVVLSDLLLYDNA